MNSKFYDNQIFANNLKRILESKNMTAAELARKIGVSKAAVSDWLKGKSLPRIDKVDKICIILNCTREDFTTDNIKPFPRIEIDENIDLGNIITITGIIPVYGEIAAGIPQLAEQRVIDYLPTTLKNPEEYFGLRVHGDSMTGAGIPDGAYVTLHIQNCAENGQIVACRVNGEKATLKRFRQQGDTIFLMPENPKYEPIIVSADDFESGYAQIMGVLKQTTINNG